MKHRKDTCSRRPDFLKRHLYPITEENSLESRQAFPEPIEKCKLTCMHPPSRLRIKPGCEDSTCEGLPLPRGGGLPCHFPAGFHQAVRTKSQVKNKSPGSRRSWLRVPKPFLLLERASPWGTRVFLFRRSLRILGG